jgi:hypothetical protein
MGHLRFLAQGQQKKMVWDDRFEPHLTHPVKRSASAAENPT